MLILGLVAIFADQPASAAAGPVPVQALPSIGDFAELERLRIEMPKPKSFAKLLNPKDLANPLQYPNDSLVKEEEGRTLAWLIVGTDGRVVRCGIEISSGSQSLDTKTCGVLMATARFEPALDQSGKPVRSIFHQPMSWKLEDETLTTLLIEGNALKRLGQDLPETTAKPRLLNGTEVANAMDYPKDALRNEDEGSVNVLLLVGADGRAERCGVVESSGSASLDSQTCNLLIAHGEFRPAHAWGGRAVPSLYRQKFVWKLERGELAGTHDVATRIKLIVGADKHIRNCTSEIIMDGQSKDGPQELCSDVTLHEGGFVAAAAEKSKVYEPLVVFESWVISSGRPLPPVGREPGETLIALRSASATYGIDGTRQGCAVTETFGFPGVVDDPCAIAGVGLPDHVQPSQDGAQTTVRLLMSIYLKGEPR